MFMYTSHSGYTAAPLRTFIAIDKLIHAERNAQDRAENEALPYLWSSVFQYKERAKFAKNLHLLNQLDSQIRAAKASVATIIGLLIDFRHDLTQLRRSTGRAQLAMQVSVELHVEILRTSLRRLRQSKEEIGTKRGRMASGNGGDVVHPGGATIGATTMAMADSEGDD